MRDFLFDSVSTDTLGIIELIAFVIAVVCFVTYVFLFVTGWFIKSIKRVYALIAIGIAGILSLFVTIGTSDELNIRKYKHIIECAENGYTLYVNGEETDFSYITPDDCISTDVTFCDEDKEVRLIARDYDLIYRIEKKKAGDEK